MILIKERQWKLILLRIVFSDYTKRRILFYHTKGYYAPTSTVLAYVLFPPVPCDSRKTARQVMASDWISTSLHGQA